MGIFSGGKKKVFREVRDAAWGHLVNKHGIDVDSLSRDYRTVEKQGIVQGKVPVTFLRVFRLSEAERMNVPITGWETFDQHPELIEFEGYVTMDNKAFLDRKNS